LLSSKTINALFDFCGETLSHIFSINADMIWVYSDNLIMSRDYSSPGGPTRSLVTLFVICAFLASMPLICEQVKAATPQTIDIAPNGYLVLQISGSSAIPSFYDVLVINGPNVDVILTDETGYVDYRNGELGSVSYSVLGTYLDTRHASYYGNLANGTHYLIIDNTFQGTAQPNGQIVRITYSSGAINAGILTGSGQSISINGILLIGGLILLLAIAAIITLMVISRSLKMKQIPLLFNRHERDLVDRAPSIRAFSDHQKPHRIYLQTKPAVRPILVHAIGRCPTCNGIIANDWTQCSKCGWTVDRSKLRPFK
jgi:hypothetical protein